MVGNKDFGRWIYLPDIKAEQAWKRPNKKRWLVIQATAIVLLFSLLVSLDVC